MSMTPYGRWFPELPAKPERHAKSEEARAAELLPEIAALPLSIERREFLHKAAKAERAHAPLLESATADDRITREFLKQSGYLRSVRADALGTPVLRINYLPPAPPVAAQKSATINSESGWDRVCAGLGIRRQ